MPLASHRLRMHASGDATVADRRPDATHAQHARHRERSGSLVTDLAAGLAAGALATWVMDQVTTALYNAEPKRVRMLEDNVRGGTTAYGKAAEKVAHSLGRDLSRANRDRFGSGIHWALGATTGAVYALLRSRVSASHLAWGLGFGAAWWLLVDETATVALGLTPGPREFPWQTHARGLAGHLAFGAVADRALAVINHNGG